MTKRDSYVLEFIEQNPCRIDSLEKLFFPSYLVATRRMSKLVDYGYCKRYRENPTSKYFYYVGNRPKQINHMDLAVKSILWVKENGYNVLNFRREVKLDGARPDAIVGIERNGEYGILMVEIERFNNTLNKKISIYEKVYREKKYFNTFKILYVCNKEIRSNVVDVINVKPNKLV